MSVTTVSERPVHYCLEIQFKHNQTGQIESIVFEYDTQSAMNTAIYRCDRCDADKGDHLDRELERAFGLNKHLWTFHLWKSCGYDNACENGARIIEMWQKHNQNQDLWWKNTNPITLPQLSSRLQSTGGPQLECPAKYRYLLHVFFTHSALSSSFGYSNRGYGFARIFVYESEADIKKSIATLNTDNPFPREMLIEFRDNINHWKFCKYEEISYHDAVNGGCYNPNEFKKISDYNDVLSQNFVPYEPFYIHDSDETKEPTARKTSDDIILKTI